MCRPSVDDAGLSRRWHLCKYFQRTAGRSQSPVLAWNDQTVMRVQLRPNAIAAVARRHPFPPFACFSRRNIPANIRRLSLQQAILAEMSARLSGDSGFGGGAFWVPLWRRRRGEAQLDTLFGAGQLDALRPEPLFPSRNDRWSASLHRRSNEVRAGYPQFPARTASGLPKNNILSALRQAM